MYFFSKELSTLHTHFIKITFYTAIDVNLNAKGLAYTPRIASPDA